MRAGLRGLGQTLITVGVVVLLFCVYELSFTGLYTQQQQKQLAEELARPVAARDPGRQESTKSVLPRAGQPLAVLRVPRLGKDYEQVVLEGVRTQDLKRGPGHYPGTALPGELGNVVISGHRTTYGAPFVDLDRLRVGDQMLLTTREAAFVYVMTGSEVVDPTAVEVLAPVPGRPGQQPRDRVLTLTTCNPKYSARQRLIVYSRQVSSRPRAPVTTSAARPGSPAAS